MPFKLLYKLKYCNLSDAKYSSDGIPFEIKGHFCFNNAATYVL